jgi:hypothetical protein
MLNDPVQVGFDEVDRGPSRRSFMLGCCSNTATRSTFVTNVITFSAKKPKTLFTFTSTSPPHPPSGSRRTASSSGTLQAEQGIPAPLQL